jgi:uncharacterized protein YjiS (DUF1127 family)
MPIAITDRIFLTPARRQPRGVGLLARLLGWLTAWEDRRHLHALSDHMLSDMGFLRDQIDDVVRGRVQRPDDKLRRLG